MGVWVLEGLMGLVGLSITVMNIRGRINTGSERYWSIKSSLDITFILEYYLSKVQSMLIRLSIKSTEPHLELPQSNRQVSRCATSRTIRKTASRPHRKAAGWPQGSHTEEPLVTTTQSHHDPIMEIFLIAITSCSRSPRDNLEPSGVRTQSAMTGDCCPLHHPPSPPRIVH